MDASSDRIWFFELVAAEQVGVRAFVRSLGVRLDAVDDVAQEAFVVAWKKRDNFQRGSNFGAWVREIAKGIVINEFRKESRRRRIMDESLSRELMEAAVVRESPDADLLRKERADLLHVCLEQVPERGRELLRLRYFEDVAPATMAGRLGISSNQIRQSLLRLRRGLLNCLREKMA